MQNRYKYAHNLEELIQKKADKEDKRNKENNQEGGRL